MPGRFIHCHRQRTVLFATEAVGSHDGAWELRHYPRCKIRCRGCTSVRYSLDVRKTGCYQVGYHRWHSTVYEELLSHGEVNN